MNLAWVRPAVHTYWKKNEYQLESASYSSVRSSPGVHLIKKTDHLINVNGTDILRHNPVMLINEEDWVAKKYQLSGVFSIDVTPFQSRFKYTPTVSVYGILDNTSKKLSDKHDARKNSSGVGSISRTKRTRVSAM